MVDGFLNLRIGFMQGRLSPILQNRIQAFPWDTWQAEFKLGAELGFKKMEWTIDSHRVESNPILTKSGQSEIIEMIEKFDIRIPSVTSDYFMENPPWKNRDQKIFVTHEKILSSMHILDSKILIIPIVDNSKIKSLKDFLEFKQFLDLMTPLAKDLGIQIALEMDLEPKIGSRLINEFDPSVIGVNYDIGNSASMGIKPEIEILEYKNKIINVHVKDRILRGSTVPLGEGAADFQTVFHYLNMTSYLGNYILQTARAKDNENHSLVLEKYATMVESWMQC